MSRVVVSYLSPSSFRPPFSRYCPFALSLSLYFPLPLLNRVNEKYVGSNVYRAILKCRYFMRWMCAAKKQEKYIIRTHVIRALFFELKQIKVNARNDCRYNAVVTLELAHINDVCAIRERKCSTNLGSFERLLIFSDDRKIRCQKCCRSVCYRGDWRLRAFSVILAQKRICRPSRSV